MTSKRIRSLLLLTLVGTGLGLALFQQRNLRLIVRYGRWLYPNGRNLLWQFLRRFALAAWEGRRFVRRYPGAHCDLAYGDHPRQRLDVFSPAGEPDWPVLVFFHGGGWESGTKDHYSSIARELAPQGIGVVLVNYRLHPDVQYPVFMQDAAAAVRWVVDHIADYGGSPQQVFLAGHSAGAHIVALLGLDERFLAEQELDRMTIKGIVGMSGPYDLTALDGHRQGDNLHSYLGAIMGGNTNLEVASPVCHTRADAPPILLLHGQLDGLVPPLQSDLLASAQAEAGGRVQVQLVEDLDHLDMILGLFRRLPEHPFSVVDEIERFIRSGL